MFAFIKLTSLHLKYSKISKFKIRSYHFLIVMFFREKNIQIYKSKRFFFTSGLKKKHVKI